MPGRKAPEVARRDQILKAAFRVALRDRLAGLRIRNVAREAGLSSGLVLFHFKTKEALIDALLGWLLASSRILRPTPPSRGRASAAVCLATLISAEARRLSTDRRRSELFFDFWVAGTRDARLRTHMRKALTDYRREFRALANDFLASKDADGLNLTADAIASAAVSFLHGCAIQAVIDPDGFDLEATVQIVERLGLSSIEPKARSKRGSENRGADANRRRSSRQTKQSSKPRHAR